VNQRRPPYSPDAERGVIGCLLVRPDLLSDLLDVGLRDEYFYQPKWAATFAAIVALGRRGEAVDPLTVNAELGDGAPRPSVDELTTAVVEVPSLGHATTYAKRVADLARLRGIISACAEVTEEAYGDGAKRDVDAFAEQVEATMLAACAPPADPGGPAEWAAVLDTTIAELEARSQGGLRGVPTGLVDLDRLSGGLRSGLTVLGARPGHGKSALALGVALHAAAHVGRVLLVSAEMAAPELAARSLTRGGVASDRVMAGRLDHVDLSRLRAERDRQARLPLIVDDRPATLPGIRARARRMKANGGLTLVVVDYLQLVGSEGRHDRREREVAEVSRGLKVLAGELGVPVLALAQLSRQVEYRAEKRPMLADLRESGGLEADADLVLLLWRPALYDLDADPGRAELVVAKHRNGPTGLVPLTWLGSRMQFRDAARPEERF
jgi:replicative DNA helicase